MPQINPNKTVLVIAQSGRLLCNLLIHNNYKCVVIDCFADVDTQNMASDIARVKDLSLAEIATHALFFKNHYRIEQVLYGSGFETHPESLFFLQQHFQLLGNKPELFYVLQDKTSFFANLAQLEIAFPDVCFEQPDPDTQWLVKPIHSAGGQGIYFANTHHSVARTCYWQRWQDGAAGSILFLANRQRAWILGFNRQLTQEIDAQPFIFNGVHNQLAINAQQRQYLEDCLTKLLSIYPLNGLGSLDFVIQQNDIYVLEINARIPASAQLYPPMILDWHIRSDQLSAFPEQPFIYPPMLYRIIFARRRIVIAEGIQWPDWAVDRPDTGTVIEQNQPLCSIITRFENTDDWMTVMKRCIEIIENLFLSGS